MINREAAVDHPAAAAAEALNTHTPTGPWQGISVALIHSTSERFPVCY